jgi:HSP20 family molecular chaperone IbpA
MERWQWLRDPTRPVGCPRHTRLYAGLARRWPNGSHQKPTLPWLRTVYEISLELPGVAGSDIDVMVQDGSLTVQGEKRFEHEEAGRTYFFSEREYGAFQRSFRLPPDVATDRIDAAFKHGVLNVRIPKLQPATLADSRKVQVRTE